MLGVGFVCMVCGSCLFVVWFIFIFFLLVLRVFLLTYGIPCAFCPGFPQLFSNLFYESSLHSPCLCVSEREVPFTGLNLPQGMFLAKFPS